ncbi:hypothetical protein [Virgibacillus sp. LDC-1]|uniref:hypothetical protein n=1 Tax=Virgibacillus sp. LDC-1 TaxID=3039856 RepID=UPI0024DE8E14|nr:hypothetical protein [Virgibacillus sp. LDC-1]
MNNKKGKMLFIGLGGMLLFLLVIQQHDANATVHSEADNTLALEQEQQSKSNGQAVKKLSEEELFQLSDQFMNTLVQESDDYYRVLDAQTKEDVILKFAGIATAEVASIYVDYYYREENGELYIVPTELPPWFQKANNYRMVQLNNHSVKVIQENQSDLDGNYHIEMEFTYDEKTWKISNVTYK